MTRDRLMLAAVVVLAALLGVGASVLVRRFGEPRVNMDNCIRDRDGRTFCEVER